MRWVAAVLVPLVGLTVAGAAAPQQSLVVLQMNLCNSGISSCYTNRSVAQAAELIDAYRPDVVTLNEICESDVATLAGRYPEGEVVAEFRTAPDRRTGEGTRCRNGELFGIGLIVRGKLSTVDGGVYDTQDLTDPEIRAWLCATTAFTACTAHLASTSAAVATAQCAQLLKDFVPKQRSTTRVVAGDLNLREKTAAVCVPPDYERTGDRDVQYALASRGAVIARRVIDMRGTTDHPALLVVFSANLPAPG